MIDLFLPYILGLALGIDPQAGPADQPEPATAQAAIDAGSGDDPAGRVPQDQVPTGLFTTATEVKPILGMTQGSWIAVRAYEGQDLLYFTHLLAWRCGLWDVRYGINGSPPDQNLVMEPCNTETGQPNGLTDVVGFPPYVTFPLDSIDSVTVEITYDDATVETATFERSAVLIP